VARTDVASFVVADAVVVVGRFGCVALEGEAAFGRRQVACRTCHACRSIEGRLTGRGVSSRIEALL